MIFQFNIITIACTVVISVAIWYSELLECRHLLQRLPFMAASQKLSNARTVDSLEIIVKKLKQFLTVCKGHHSIG
jgi:hypothetical protein